MIVNARRKHGKSKTQHTKRGQETHQMVALRQKASCLRKQYFHRNAGPRHEICIMAHVFPGTAHCAIIAARQRSMKTPFYINKETAKRPTIPAPRIAQVRAVLPAVTSTVQEQLHDHILLNFVERHATPQSGGTSRQQYPRPTTTDRSSRSLWPLPLKPPNLPDCSRHPS